MFQNTTFQDSVVQPKSTALPFYTCMFNTTCKSFQELSNEVLNYILSQGTSKLPQLEYSDFPFCKNMQTFWYVLT